MNDMVIWIIFGSLILFLVGFMAYSFARDKKRNKELLKKKIELNKNKEKKSKEISVLINSIIKRNQLEVDKVSALNSKLKMKQVNQHSKKMLSDIRKEKIFKIMYLIREDNEKEHELVGYIDSLIATKSNMWVKKCNNSLKYFEDLDLKFQSNDEYETFKKESEELVNRSFDEIKSS